MNYLITTAIGGILWVITAVFLGEELGNTMPLATLSVEEFLVRYRIALAAAAVMGLLSVFYWYFYGSKDSTAGELDRAKRIWYSSFVGQIIIAVGIVVILVILFLSEGLTTIDYLIIFALVSLHTYIFFWLCTFFMSPRTVKYIPPFRG
jgi:hypothetical protein